MISNSSFLDHENTIMVLDTITDSIVYERLARSHDDYQAKLEQLSLGSRLDSLC